MAPLFLYSSNRIMDQLISVLMLTVIFIFHRSLSKTWEIVMALELSRMIIW